MKYSGESSSSPELNMQMKILAISTRLMKFIFNKNFTVKWTNEMPPCNQQNWRIHLKTAFLSLLG